MASPPHSSTIENLPPEILSNIFLRLMLFSKQLAQMRSVSKPWNALLSESSFVKSHLHRSIESKNKTLLVFVRGFSFHSKPFTAHTCRSPHIELTDFIKRRPHVKLQSDQYTNCRVIGSVNGLICFSSTDIFNTSLHIWNPSLSAMMTLPEPFLPLSPANLLKTNNFMRFGFDPKSDDYKLVKLTGTSPPPDYLSLESFFSFRLDTLQAEIYSMRKGSWQLSTQKLPPHITWVEDQNEVYVDGQDGHLHWLCKSVRKGKKQVILAVDLGDDSFYEIRLPNSVADCRKTRFNVLGRLRGKLCLMSTVVDVGCELWMLKEYGISKYWVKCPRLITKVGNIVPYGITSQSEFCFQAKNDLFLSGKKFNVFAKQHKIVEYVDSLVWVEPVKCENSCSNSSSVQICKWGVDPSKLKEKARHHHI